MTDYRAIVLGASGAVGSALLAELLAAPNCSAVTILVRRQLDQFANLPGQEKLTQVRVEMEQLEESTFAAAKGSDVAFSTLGIGDPNKVSPEELWQVEVDYNTAFARGCKKAGVHHFSLLSAIEANPQSPTYYLKAKGSAEQAIRDLALERTSFFRPSLIVTENIRYGLRERLLRFLMPLSWMLPQRFHQIHLADLARAMRLNAEAQGASSVPAEILFYQDLVALLGQR